MAFSCRRDRPEGRVLLRIGGRESREEHRPTEREKGVHRRRPRAVPARLSQARVEEDEGVGQLGPAEMRAVQRALVEECT